MEHLRISPQDDNILILVFGGRMTTKLPDDWFVQSALDAAQTAYEIGYRPCIQCGSWLLPKHMTAAIDAETGEGCFYCPDCGDTLAHLVEVPHGG